MRERIERKRAERRRAFWDDFASTFGLPGSEPASFWRHELHPLTPAQIGDYTPRQLMNLWKALHHG